MERIWYLFEELGYYYNDKKGKLEECHKEYYIYNSKTSTFYVSSDSLTCVLTNLVKSHEAPFSFTYPIMKGQVPLFEPYNSVNSCYDYEVICNALPKIMVGETFVKEAVVCSYEVKRHNYKEKYKQYADPVKKYLEVLEEYKKYLKDKNYPVSLTQEEIGTIKQEYNIFLDITLLHASDKLPTIEYFKKKYPERLIN